MKITVSQDHIDNGIKADCGACPVALALYEVIPNKVIVVYPEYVKISRETAFLPRHVTNFIRNFDTTEHPKWLEPFDFELDYEVEEKE